ncbi:MAG: ribose 5-phosphate isomerase B [Clostridia bacterium]|nr:ribose 5-phosphate isomerase B [Clostridia bacterium]
MKIALGADHGGYKLKDKIAAHLSENGHEVVDFGTNSPESCDYPDFADPVCRAVAGGECDFGILVCSTGIGMSMAANKHAGIRAACCSETVSVALTRAHNNANVLTLGEFIVGEHVACEMADIFIGTPFSEGERHIRRINKVMELEKNTSDIG